MKLKYFVLFSIFLTLFIFTNNPVRAGEPLVKYEFFYVTNPATGLRVPDSANAAFYGIQDEQKFTQSGIASLMENPNKPLIGFPDDCYPDDPNNPEGNIVISGRIISNFTNKPVNGAVLAVYMGAEQLDNIADSPEIKFQDKFVHGGKDYDGKLTNLYYYDVSKDGQYKVYACNAYKQLSERRKQELKKYSPNLFNNPLKPCNVDGYSGDSAGCTSFDYVKAFPKFSMAVICGMKNTSDSENPSPVIGEIYSIDNYNSDYKSANPPSYMRKQNFDIRVNCFDDNPAFPVPSHLQYDSVTNVASCRIDDISPNLQNYFTKVQKPLKNDFQDFTKFTLPNSTLIPDETALSECTNPDDIFCLKNFITKSFPKPQKNINVFDYGNKTILDEVNANPITKDNTLTYVTTAQLRKIDLSDEELPNESDWIARSRGSTEGQLDAKIDMKSFISDYKFDINSLKELYACFTTFNAPAVRSNAEIEELKRKKFTDGTALQNEFYNNNLRIPSCRELYCGTEFVPDDKICKFKKPELFEREKYGKDFTIKSPYQEYTQYNALSGYGPGVTLNFKSLEEITNDLLVLSKQLIDSDFNPKKSMPANIPVLYKSVNKVSDIVACLDDNQLPVYLNGVESGKKEGSITYSIEGQETTFFSPVPLMSYISIPYTMELFHSIEGDNYANFTKSDPNNNLIFPEQCNMESFANATNKTQLFANCRKAVLPGGVYSVSALRVIANICNNIVKIPTADAGNFSRVINSSQKNEFMASAAFAVNNGVDVELSVTKIGTPVSVCLCRTGDPNCSISSSLNNKLSAQDFAISSIVGEANQSYAQGGSSNALGSFCDNYHQSMTSKEPAINCQLRIKNLGDWNLMNKPENNFLGTNNNLRIKWDFGYDEINTPTAHDFLTYTYTGNEAPYPPYYQAYVKNGANGGWGATTLSNDINRGPVPCKRAAMIKYVDGVETPRDSGEACVENSATNTRCKVVCKDPVGVPPTGIGLSRDPKQISSLTNRTTDFDKGTTQIPEITKLDEGAGESNDYVSPQIRVVQLTRDGTNGLAFGRFKMRNAKYDPIPDLLNDFRKYSIYGAVPGNGGEYCRTPKIGSSVDIQASTFNIRNPSATGDINDTYTAGMHCNSQIPEEMDRCEDPLNWPQPWVDGWNKEGFSTSQKIEACKQLRCQQFCTNHSITYYFVELYKRQNQLDPTKTDYFCKNYGATKGVEFQVNSGNEGCVLDYTSNMKQVYANPAEVSSDYVSAYTNNRYSKDAYPVYNDNYCLNPSDKNPSDPRYTYDKSNCKPFMKTSFDAVNKYNSTGNKTPNK